MMDFEKVFILGGCGQNCVFMSFFVLKNTNIVIFDDLLHVCCVYSDFGALMYQRHFFVAQIHIIVKISFEVTGFVVNSLVCPKSDIYAASNRHRVLKRQKTSFFSRQSLGVLLQNWRQFDTK